MTSPPSVDIAIVGAGVVGIALARHLLLQSSTLSVALVEALPTVLCGASSGNSAMIHCGFDCTPGSLEQRMVVRGHEMFTAFASSCARRGVHVPWVPSGAIMLAMTEDELTTLRTEVAPKAVKNGVSDVRMLSKQEVLSMEPHVSQSVVGGLHIPREWIVDPWHYPALLLAEAASSQRLRLVHSCRVVKVEQCANVGPGNATGYRLWDQKDTCRVEARVVANCAGLKGDVVEALCPVPSHLQFRLFPRLGRFLKFPPSASPMVQHALLPIPTKKSKGIIVFRTVFGQVYVGPTAEDPDEPKAPQQAVMKALHAAAASKVPALASIPCDGAYAGARPALRDQQDYYVDLDSRGLGWFTVAGVRSTGLTSSVALAELVAPRIAAFIGARLLIGMDEVPAEAVAASLQRLMDSGSLSYERRHPISLEGNPRPKL